MKRLVLLLLLAGIGSAEAASAQRATDSPLRVVAVNRTAAAEAQGGAARPSEAVLPGDVVSYQLTFTNSTGGRIRGVTLSNPIPRQLRFVEGSARATRDDAKAEFSADGGATFSERPMEEVVIDGRPVSRPVSVERYTHVRWIVSGWLQPGAVARAEFQARFPAARAAASSPREAR